MNEDEIRQLIFKSFQDHWNSYPSQDNEGYQPERGSYKCGFIDGFNFGRHVGSNLRESTNDQTTKS